MKKVLFATTAIVLSAGVAAAQTNVTITGTARVGLAYTEDAGGVGGRDARIEQRLRFNIDAAKETDSGVTMGGRIRLQYDENVGAVTQTGNRPNGNAAVLNAAYVYASIAGLRVEIGNSNTALDATKLLYASEIGFIGQSFGNSPGSFAAYATGEYGPNQNRRMGVFASYALGDGTVRASYLTPDQRFSNVTEEFSMSADYVFGAITVSGGFALDGNFIAGNDVYFLGGQYAVNSDANVGLLLHRSDNGAADQFRATLYGSYQFGAITGRGYIAYDDAVANASDVAFGIGADYDLGGATLAGHVARGYAEQTEFSLGVKFSF